jgi:hypothetical protein
VAIQPIGSGRIEYTQGASRPDQTVFEVQRALNQLAGARVVPENGAFDRYTFDAIRNFQQAHSADGLRPSGIIDQRTIDTMNRELSRRFGQPQTTRSAPAPLPADMQAKSLENSIHAAAARAQVWANQGAAAHQAQFHRTEYRASVSNPGNSGGPGRLQRDSQIAGTRADLMMNTNEAWSALRTGGRHPLQDAKAVLADQRTTRSAERHLNRVAQALTRDGGPEAYRSMPEDDRAKIWAAALLSEPAAGQRVMGQLTGEARQTALEDLQAARDALLKANPDPQTAAAINSVHDLLRSTPEAGIQ